MNRFSDDFNLSGFLRYFETRSSGSSCKPFHTLTQKFLTLFNARRSLKSPFFTPLILLLLTLHFFSFPTVRANPIHPASKDELRLLNEVDKKYQKDHGLHLKFKKIVKLEILGKENKSEGEIWINQGKIRVESQKPEVSTMVTGSQFLWIETPPPKGFEDAKTQVLKTSLNSKRTQSQGLIQILIRGGVLKYFKISGVQSNKESDKEMIVTYFLQPNKQSSELKRAQIQINSNSKEISQLRYWDQMNNETRFDFFETKFKQKIDQSIFQYQPPKDAEIMTY